MKFGNIAGFDDKYRISQFGHVLNTETGKVSKGSVDKPSGYVKINFCCGDKSNTFLMHRLVAIAFIPNPDNLPQVHHKDGDKTNNHVDNLEWVSRKTHGGKMTDDQKKKFRETYQKNLKKRKNLKKGNWM